MLNVVSLNEAVNMIENGFQYRLPDSDTVSLDETYGRILGEDLISRENIPAFNRSTLDGYAVIASDTFGAGAAIPSMLHVIGEIKMGQETVLTLSSGECAVIPTGGMLPKGADAVVPVEHTELEGDLCLCYSAVSPLQNVTATGDDISAGETILKKGTVIRSADVGILAAMGYDQVNVFRKPRVGILSTGNEIISVDKTPKAGQIRDVNSHLLHALCSSYGCECRSYGIFQDCRSKLIDAVGKAVRENDMVLLSGGSSAGKSDLSAEIISELGEVLFHGIAVKPGKPTILGNIDGKAVVCLPGHPAACWFMTELLVKKHISRLLRCNTSSVSVKAVLNENISSNHGREELLCVHFHNGTAEPIYAKSGVISQLCAANGYVMIPRESEGMQKGSEVIVYLL